MQGWVLPVATLVLLVIVAIVGGVVVIVHPATLDFASYVKDVAYGFGLLAIGRGLDTRTRP